MKNTYILEYGKLVSNKYDDYINNAYNKYANVNYGYKCVKRIIINNKTHSNQLFNTILDDDNNDYCVLLESNLNKTYEVIKFRYKHL